MLETKLQITEERDDTIPLYITDHKGLAETLRSIGETAQSWSHAAAFTARAGDHLLVPNSDGTLSCVIAGAPSLSDPFGSLALGMLSRSLPPADYSLKTTQERPDLTAIGWLLGSYSFNVRTNEATNTQKANLVLPVGCNQTEIERIVRGCHLAIDLVNRPANDLGPEALAKAAIELAEKHGAKWEETVGDDLLDANFPLIHTVGRAYCQEPRLVDMIWGNPDHPKVTLVGKGVTFDTGGLDLKPPSSMALMKKDMGGAANILGLAHMIMDAKLNIRLRVLIPIVENSVAGTAFRPGDILTSRHGLMVEVGNTDAEGRLILADALALADEEAPELIVDMATLTGAARVALGPDLTPFYTHDDNIADELNRVASSEADPLWRMPLWQPYDEWLNSDVGDICNAPNRPFAGSIIAALFLDRFVSRTSAHIHIDVYAWTPETRPHALKGGAAQGIRSLYALLKNRYSA